MANSLRLNSAAEDLYCLPGRRLKVKASNVNSNLNLCMPLDHRLLMKPQDQLRHGLPDRTGKPGGKRDHYYTVIKPGRGNSNVRVHQILSEAPSRPALPGPPVTSLTQ